MNNLDSLRDVVSQMSKEALQHAVKALQEETDGDKQLASVIMAEALGQTNSADITFTESGYIAPCDTTQYIPIPLSRKQRLLLTEPATEILMGGQAAGGKSIGLCHAAVQYAHVPGYHALMFRRTKPNGQDLVDRMCEFLHGKASFSADHRGGRFTFPSGAMVDIAYMQHDKNKYDYKGVEYTRIIFDELTEFLASQYRYLFSRLRKPRCPYHYDDIEEKGFDKTCHMCRKAGLLSRIPLKVISSCNPDGEGREWVRDRFVTPEAMDDIDNKTPKDRYITHTPLGDRCFIPASVEDNPGINAEEYRRTVSSAMTREEVAQLLHGSWRTSEGAIFHESMFGLYVADDIHLYPYGQTIGLRICDSFRFFTIDVAHTSAKRALAAKGSPSWTVVGIWDYWNDPQPFLCLRYIWRRRAEWLEVKRMVPELANEWQPSVIVIEDTTGSKSLISEVRQNWFVKSFNPQRKEFKGRTGHRTGKLDRSHQFQLMCEQGQVYVPKDTRLPWVDTYLLEMCTWHGFDEETADQVDVSSMAALEVRSQPTGGQMRQQNEIVIDLHPVGNNSWAW